MPKRGVGVAESGIQRVVRVVGEVHLALERQRAQRQVDVLRLEAVVQVEPGLDRVASHDLGQADRDVVGRDWC